MAFSWTKLNEECCATCQHCDLPGRRIRIHSPSWRTIESDDQYGTCKLSNRRYIRSYSGSSADRNCHYMRWIELP